ncbi:MAG: hypothetical protein K9J12_17800 [Melioribacteraceae bacterium]|nr:hypothetical protein [Melioribacteraceae bacterium]MCF8263502.1 hypothetical protein [Melioribacteraceae bacterium]MCF8296944.1 hypothetical protein [Saprospiraceae bacterium]
MNQSKQTTEDKILNFFVATIKLVEPLGRNIKTFLIFNFIAACLIAVFLLLFAKPYFDSKLIIYPEASSARPNLSGISSLASMVGVSLESGTSINIYSDILKSETLFEEIIYSKYQTESFPDSVNLIEYYEVEADEEGNEQFRKRKQFLAVYELLSEELVTANMDRISQILVVNIRMPEAKLSSEVAVGIARSLDKYLREKRKTNASEQTSYLSKRLVDIGDSLQIVEDKLKSFLERNKLYENSPELQLTYVRLRRNVEVYQTVYIELTKQYELSKLTEIKDTPILNIRELPEQPVEKSGPRRTLFFLIVMTLSSIISSIYFIYVKYQLPVFVKKLKNSLLSRRQA